MNKIDLFFAKNFCLTYILCVVIVPACIGFVCCKVADTMNEAFQYGTIASVIWILFYLPKIKKYNKFNKEQQANKELNK